MAADARNVQPIRAAAMLLRVKVDSADIFVPLEGNQKISIA
jgi:hypothetical protein